MGRRGREGPVGVKGAVGEPGQTMVGPTGTAGPRGDMYDRIPLRPMPDGTAQKPAFRLSRSLERPQLLNSTPCLP